MGVLSCGLPVLLWAAFSFSLALSQYISFNFDEVLFSTPPPLEIEYWLALHLLCALGWP